LDPPLQLPKTGNLRYGNLRGLQVAFISAPEANSIIVVDLKNHQVTKLLPLGYKDMNLRVMALMPATKMMARSISATGPSGIISTQGYLAYRGGNDILIVTANEGNLRDKPPGSKRKTSQRNPLDSTAFQMRSLCKKTKLGRLGVSNVSGRGRMASTMRSTWEVHAQCLFSPVSTDISCLTPVLNSSSPRRGCASILQFSSTAIFSTIAVQERTGIRKYHRGFDWRRRYAFGIAERIGGVWIYDITDPGKAVFQQYINTAISTYLPIRSACPGTPACQRVNAGDLEPEEYGSSPQRCHRPTSSCRQPRASDSTTCTALNTCPAALAEVLVRKRL